MPVNCSATWKGCERNFCNFASAGDGELVVFAEFVDAENGDDVLEIFVTLQDALDALRDVVMLLPDDARGENARCGCQRIDGGINPSSDWPAEYGGGVQVSEGCGRSGIGQIVGGNVNGLHRGDGTFFGGSDALLQLAHFCGEVWLVTDG